MLRLVFPQWRRTERALSSPQEVPLAQPGCELGAGRRSNDAADWKVDWKVRAPRFASAFTDRILRMSKFPFEETRCAGRLGASERIGHYACIAPAADRLGRRHRCSGGPASGSPSPAAPPCG